MSAVIITKTRQWRSGERVSFRPHDKKTSDFLEKLTKRERSAKLNRAITNLFMSAAKMEHPALAQPKTAFSIIRTKSKPFNPIVFQLTQQNQKSLAPYKCTRGRVAAIIRLAIQQVIP